MHVVARFDGAETNVLAKCRRDASLHDHDETLHPRERGSRARSVGHLDEAHREQRSVHLRRGEVRARARRIPSRQSAPHARLGSDDRVVRLVSARRQTRQPLAPGLGMHHLRVRRPRFIDSWSLGRHLVRHERDARHGSAPGSDASHARAQSQRSPKYPHFWSLAPAGFCKRVWV